MLWGENTEGSLEPLLRNSSFDLIKSLKNKTGDPGTGQGWGISDPIKRTSTKGRHGGQTETHRRTQIAHRIFGRMKFPCRITVILRPGEQQKQPRDLLALLQDT